VKVGDDEGLSSRGGGEGGKAEKKHEEKTIMGGGGRERTGSGKRADSGGERGGREGG